MTAKLKQAKAEIMGRRHLPVPEQGKTAGQRDRRAPAVLRRARELRRGEHIPHPDNPALAPRAPAPQPENPAHLGTDEPHRSTLAAPHPHPAPLPRTALRRHPPMVGAQCGNPARWDLRGGLPARAVPHRDDPQANQKRSPKQFCRYDTGSSVGNPLCPRGDLNPARGGTSPNGGSITTPN